MIRTIISWIPEKAWLALCFFLLVGFFSYRAAYYGGLTTLSIQQLNCNNAAILKIEEIIALDRSEQRPAIDDNREMLASCAKQIDPKKPVAEAILEFIDKQSKS